MTAPNGLGISPSDRQLLQAEVDTVIHCAADIRLEVGIQELLCANFEGTRQLLELAGSCRSLSAFVHVSSAYVNMNATPGSLVQESIYSLSYGDQPVNAFELAQVCWRVLTYVLLVGSHTGPLAAAAAACLKLSRTISQQCRRAPLQ